MIKVRILLGHLRCCRFRVISHMNIFFTCKNTLVILLQLYRWEPDDKNMRQNYARHL